ncbi:MAG: hypothetical protein QN144_14505 [Armatimonadota bacterium]|nr:hypothetical protein [Armatimonadota bacterium]
MRRQPLDDGRWFDRDRAQVFREGHDWDGRNNISRATGSQWAHEELYLTANGRWVLHWWSQWVGSRPTWREISKSEAARWLIKNGYDPADVGLNGYAADSEL